MAVPPLALAAGFGAQELLGRLDRPRLARALLVLFLCSTAVYGAKRCAGWLASPEEQVSFRSAQRVLDQARPVGERVVVFSDGDPKALWYLDRKGWVLDEVRDGLASLRVAPRIAVLDHTRLQLVPGRRESAREALRDAGYRELFDDTAVGLWLAE